MFFVRQIFKDQKSSTYSKITYTKNLQNGIKEKMTFSQATATYENSIFISTVQCLIKNHKTYFKINFKAKPSMHK